MDRPDTQAPSLSTNPYSLICSVTNFLGIFLERAKSKEQNTIDVSPNQGQQSAKKSTSNGHANKLGTSFTFSEWTPFAITVQLLGEMLLGAHGCARHKLCPPVEHSSISFGSTAATLLLHSTLEHFCCSTFRFRFYLYTHVSSIEHIELTAQ